MLYNHTLNSSWTNKQAQVQCPKCEIHFGNQQMPTVACWHLHKSYSLTVTDQAFGEHALSTL